MPRHVAPAGPLALALVLAASGVARPAGPEPARAAAGGDDVDARVFLVGDAGVPLASDPVLGALREDVAVAPARSVVVFLGDNVYPRGLPGEGTDARPEAERRLLAQVDAAQADGARTLFIPGNHDWDKQGKGGWDAIRRQGEFLERHGRGAVLEPKDGCPGPVVVDVHDRVRLVLLDTQWWLHGGPRPAGEASTCPQKTEAEVVDALASAIRGADGRRVVVAGHHPLESGGAHGGHFSWQDHVFPLRNAKPWLFVPLPVIGSLYPIVRGAGWATPQDVPNPQNRRMREALTGVFAKDPPLVYVAGHEHNLQVLKGYGSEVLLVSGAGAYGHLAWTTSTEATLFARAASGYMRLDVGRDGGVRLAVVTVAADGRASEAYTLDLSS